MPLDLSIMALGSAEKTDHSTLLLGLSTYTLFEKHNKQNFAKPASSSTTEFTSVEQRFCTMFLALFQLVQKPVPTEIN